MSDGPPTPEQPSAEAIAAVRAARSHRPLPATGHALGILGLLLVFASPVLYTLLLDVPVLARTGLVMWLLMPLGLAVSVVAWWRTRSRIALGASVLGLLLTGFMPYAFFEISKLPAREEFAVLDRAPAFEVTNQAGERVKLNDLVAGHRALLLVFYRGHW